MKKLLTIIIAACALGVGTPASAQKFVLIDMEYILKNVPAYERANEQLNQISRKWQAEIEALAAEAQQLYKTYQSEAVFLSAEQKTERESAKGYSLVLDRASDAGIIFASPKIDISSEVLQKMGYGQ